MTNPAFNRRKLGRYSDWQMFGLDMVREIRRRGGPSYPIMYRIDLSLALNETYGEDGMSIPALKKFKNGRSVEDTLEYMEHLVEAGVDMFDVDLGCYDNWWLPHPPAGMPAGCFLDVSEIVKARFQSKKILSNAGLPVPVVAVGKLGYPDIAEKALRDNKCDMVMLGRPLLADPDWPAKAYAGNVSDIRPCIGCQEGCINEFVDGGHPQCAVNPRSGFENVIDEIPAPASSPKRIAVVGGGPAGVTFAVTTAGRGHRIDLYEKSGEIGGRLLPGSVPKIKYEVANYRKYLRKILDEAVAEGSVTLHLNTPVDPEALKDKGYDSIVFAVGTVNAAPKLPGMESAKTVQAVDLLSDPTRIGSAKNIVVIGGGVVGCETAYWLAYEHGLKVTVVEMLPHLMKGVCTANRGHLIYYLKKAGVRLMNAAKVVRFETAAWP
jgi:2-enoate reductase